MDDKDQIHSRPFIVDSAQSSDSSMDDKDALPPIMVPSSKQFRFLYGR